MLFMLPDLPGCPRCLPTYPLYAGAASSTGHCLLGSRCFFLMACSGSNGKSFMNFHKIYSLLLFLLLVPVPELITDGFFGMETYRVTHNA